MQGFSKIFTEIYEQSSITNISVLTTPKIVAIFRRKLERNLQNAQWTNLKKLSIILKVIIRVCSKLESAKKISFFDSATYDQKNKAHKQPKTTKKYITKSYKLRSLSPKAAPNNLEVYYSRRFLSSSVVRSG